MNEIVFDCPICKQHIKAPANMAGKLVDCPSCRQTITIPATHPVAVEAGAPSPKSAGKIRRVVLCSVTLVGVLAIAGLFVFFRPQRQSPIGVVKRYLAANKWEDRLSYVLNPENVQEQMESRYSNFRGPRKFMEIRELSGNPLSTNGWMLVYVLFDRRPGVLGTEDVDDALFFVLKTDEGYKIDWEASTIANPMTLSEFKARRPRTPVRLRIAASLNSDSGSTQLRDEFWFFNMDIPNQDFMTVLSEKGSHEGESLFDLVRGGRRVPVIVDIYYDEEIDEYVVDSFVQHGWAYSDQAQCGPGAYGTPQTAYSHEQTLPAAVANRNDQMYDEGYKAGMKWSGTSRNGRPAGWDDFVQAMKDMGTDIAASNKEEADKWARYKRGFVQALADAGQ